MCSSGQGRSPNRGQGSGVKVAAMWKISRFFPGLPLTHDGRTSNTQFCIWESFLQASPLHGPIQGVKHIRLLRQGTSLALVTLPDRVPSTL